MGGICVSWDVSGEVDMGSRVEYVGGGGGSEVSILGR